MRRGERRQRKERERERRRVESSLLYIIEYESPYGYSTYRELDCKVEINIIRYEVRRLSASRGKERNAANTKKYR